MPTYTAWPTVSDVDAALSATNLTLPAGITSTIKQQKIDAVADEVLRITHRQFVAGNTGEVRYFDGSGTGRQVVDEYVTFETAQVIGYLGPAQSLNLLNVAEEVSNTFPKDAIIIFRGSLPAYGRVWLDRFPMGRRNIKVTAKWGYSASIPVDLWEAVLEESVRRVLTYVWENIRTNPVGWREADISEWYASDMIRDAGSRWEKKFRDVLRRYRKPIIKRMDLRNRRMV